VKGFAKKTIRTPYILQRLLWISCQGTWGLQDRSSFLSLCICKCKNGRMIHDDECPTDQWKLKATRTRLDAAIQLYCTYYLVAGKNACLFSNVALTECMMIYNIYMVCCRGKTNQRKKVVVLDRWIGRCQNSMHSTLAGKRHLANGSKLIPLK